ncbi:Alpha-ketoglutarate-dependent sulfonate dioxygenase 4 [Phlyctema vagabunda]|uniref:Alpha-ketoglutarate-dependent sulfonate dioxygenase 4 n=1 Tax=Phlyctema vagabunda TaxID=108571 RepID=A0ABR4PLG5_9HELO
MAPSRTDNDHHEPPAPKTTYDINVPYSKPDDLETLRGRTEFPEYLAVWEPNLWFDSDFPVFEYHDPALRADKAKPNLFQPGVTIKHITPRMGSVLTGIKLETLSPAAKDELALLISERKIVAIREQSSFLHSGPSFQENFMEYFGKLSTQPVSGAIKGHPNFHIIHRDNNEEEIAKFFKHKSTSTLWHHDVSYERQPPGYVMLGIMACPEVGGDTVFADTAMAYKRLSPTFQAMIDNLKAVHTSRKMIAHVRAARGAIRADPIDSIHPIVRVHPVTGERAIFLNAEFLDEIVGLKENETELILKFLMDHVSKGHDFQCRVQWEKHSVVMFDGRNTQHTATVDYDSRVQARHLFRLAAMTEVPLSVEDSQKEIIDGPA